MKKCLLLLFSLLFPLAAQAQGPITGMPPFGSFQTSSFDTIDRFNMNVNFSIPIVSSPGRGLPLNFAIVYDSSVWWRPPTPPNWTANTGGGWKLNFPTGRLNYWTQATRCDTIPVTYVTRYYNFTFTDAAGTVHPIGLNFYQTNSCDLNPQTPRSGSASDSSGYLAVATAPNNITVKGKSGTIVGAPSMIDSNGNSYSSTVVNSSETDWIDSAGHTALKVIASGTNILYEYPDTTGAYQTATLKQQSYNVKTNFACSLVTEYTGTQTLPYELDLANGQKYTFSYEADRPDLLVQVK
jgi:hypothetical protein